MKTNIFVLCGGKSVEHDISLKSASAIINAIDKDKYRVYPVYITNDGRWCNHGLWERLIESPDELRMETTDTLASSIGSFLLNVLNEDEKNFVIPALHGPNGEDGTIQGMLELLEIPYLGNEVLSSALAMDKAMTKDIFAKHNLPQVKHLTFTLHNWKTDEGKSYGLVEKEIGYPCYVKPANGGSSVGISRAGNLDDLKSSFREAFKYDGKIVVEKEVLGREMQTSVVGNNEPQASVPGEFILERPFFDYNAKYIDNKLIPVVPANLTPDTMERVRALAVEAFKALDCRGLARVDIFVTEDNDLLINEVNTMPGFTPVSMTPVLWNATDGTSYAELIERLIGLGLERFEEKMTLVNKR